MDADKINLKRLVSLLTVKPLFQSLASYRPLGHLAQIIVKNWILNMGDQFPMVVVVTNVNGYRDNIEPLLCQALCYLLDIPDTSSFFTQ